MESYGINEYLNANGELMIYASHKIVGCDVLRIHVRFNRKQKQVLLEPKIIIPRTVDEKIGFVTEIFG